MEKKRNTELISSVLYIIIGILLVIFRSETLSWVMTAAGIFFIICGVIDIIGKNFVNGAVSLIIGIAILVLGWTLAKIVLLVFGILIAIKGLILLFEVIQKKKKADYYEGNGSVERRNRFDNGARAGSRKKRIGECHRSVNRLRAEA